MRTLLTIMVATIFVACGPQEPSSDLHTFIPSQTGYANLFSGYNSGESEFSEICVGAKQTSGDGTTVDFRDLIRTGDIVENGKITIQDSLSVSRIISLTQGGASGSLDVGLFAGSGAFDYAVRSAQTSYSRSYVFYASLYQDMFIDHNLLQLTNTGQKYTNQDSEYYEDSVRVCGDEFVSEVTRGVSLLATVKVNFSKEEDMEKFGGNISADFKVAKISGSFGSLDEETKQRTSIEVFGTQIGGSSENIVALMPDEPASCTLATLDKCEEMMAQFRDYITDFVETDALQDLESYTPFMYKTESYANYSVTRDIVEEYQPPAIEFQIRETKESLASLLIDRLQLYQRTDKMINTFKMGDERLKSVGDTKTILKASISEIRRIYAICEKGEEECLTENDILQNKLINEFSINRNGLWL